MSIVPAASERPVGRHLRVGLFRRCAVWKHVLCRRPALRAPEDRFSPSAWSAGTAGRHAGNTRRVIRITSRRGFLLPGV